MLSVVILSVIILSVVVLSVLAPDVCPLSSFVPVLVLSTQY